MNTFSATGAIASGWALFKKRPGIFIGAMVVVALAQIALELISRIPGIGDLVAFVLGIFVGMGVLSFAIAAYENIQAVSINNLVRTSPFWRYFIATLVKGFIASAPFGVAILLWMFRVGSEVTREDFQLGVLTISLGIITLLAFAWLVYVSIKLLWVEYFILQKDAKPMEAIKESFKITNGQWWNLFVFTLLVIAVNIVGFIALIVGLLVSVPVSMLAMVHVFKKLTGQNTGSAPVSVPTASQTM